MFTKKTLVLAMLGLVFCALLLWSLKFWQSTTGNAAIHFLNVGQGDAILIQSTTNETILIDTGPDNRVVYQLSEALPAYDKTIETLIITHPDSDHAGGVFEVLRHYKVNRILTSGFKQTSSHSQRIVREISRRKIPLIPVDASSDFIFENGEHDGIIDILYPFKPVVFSSEKANNDSVVIRFTLGGTTFLFTGDIEKEIEEKLVNTYRKGELNVDILKLPHHGSKTSSTEDFLRATSPLLAIASLGKKNRYGHPHSEVIERLKALKIPLRRTDIEGRITCLPFHAKLCP